MLAFKLTKQFASGPEKEIATFADEKAAADFMDAQVGWDHKTKVKTIYRLYENDEMLVEVDSSQYESLGSAESTGPTKSSAPTPLGTSPKPAGMPHYKKEDIDDENE